MAELSTTDVANLIRQLTSYDKDIPNTPARNLIKQALGSGTVSLLDRALKGDYKLFDQILYNIADAFSWGALSTIADYLQPDAPAAAYSQMQHAYNKALAEADSAAKTYNDLASLYDGGFAAFGGYGQDIKEARDAAAAKYKVAVERANQYQERMLQ